MSIQANDIAASLQRASLVQQINAAHEQAERVAANQAAADIEKLARAAEEEVNTSAPTAGKHVHERDAGQGSDYLPQRRRRPHQQQEDEPSQPPPSPPGEGTIIDIEA